MSWLQKSVPMLHALRGPLEPFVLQQGNTDGDNVMVRSQRPTVGSVSKIIHNAEMNNGTQV